MTKHIRSISLCVALTLLLAAAACGLSGCVKSNTSPEAPQALPTAVSPETATLPDASLPPEVAAEISEALEGVRYFVLEVTGKDGVTQTQTITTTCTTVGEALLEYGMIEGEEGEYGLYIKTVLGETHDYNEDGKYWAFYVGGEYATTGADATEIIPGTVYAFIVE